MTPSLPIWGSVECSMEGDDGEDDEDVEKAEDADSIWHLQG